MPLLRAALAGERKRAHVPDVRDPPIRAPAVSRRRGSRSGVSARVANDIAGRLRDIRAVWFAVHNDPDKTVAEVAAEFYYIVGEILEGRTLRALSLRNINRDRVNTHAEE